MTTEAKLEELTTNKEGHILTWNQTSGYSKLRTWKTPAIQVQDLPWLTVILTGQRVHSSMLLFRPCFSWRRQGGLSHLPSKLNLSSALLGSRFTPKNKKQSQHVFNLEIISPDTQDSGSKRLQISGPGLVRCSASWLRIYVLVSSQLR